jgi:hypothetical protein
MRWVWGLIALIAVMAPGVSAQDKTPATPNTANPGDTSAIEQALIEHACRSQLPGIAGSDAYQDCQSERLRSLRADFGRDLSRVTVADRKTLDSACSKARAAEGREAYLECITLQLAAIRNRRNPNPQASDATTLPVPSENAEPTSLAVPAAELSSSLSPVWIVVGVVTLVAAIGGAFLAVKNRRVITRKCRVCGEDVPQGGDLCPKCRHEAAEALRQAAADRAEEERAHKEELRRQSQREEELRQQRARENEEARLRQQEDERRREEDALRREQEEEESRQRSRAAGVEAEDVFDPYAILGVPRDADKEAIDAACQEARLKYAPEQVAHLGSELQEHYKRKAEAVERAYKILTE